MPPANDKRSRRARAGEGVPAPAALVIFGASGDLAARKLLPALQRLEAAGRLPGSFAILGAGRTPWSAEQFREHALQALRASEPAPAAADLERFARLLRYHRVDYGEPADFERLAAELARLDRELGLGNNFLFYLATPPDAYAPIARQLLEAGLSCAEGSRRIVVEKPFGSDLASARELNRELRRCFPESDIYRIDHYLGKFTVQNLFVLRFANGIFEPVWNRRYVDHVQITVAESAGIEGRAQYYERAGALRDMLQNHLLQLLCLAAMEPPAALGAEAVRDEKTKVLQAARPLPAEQVARCAARGQYGPGAVEGEPVPGYREEPGVAADSETETFAALELRLDNWRWAGVPFYLRSGKRLPRRVSEIAIQFKGVPHRLFQPEGRAIEPSVLIVRIQPGEGVALRFQAREPGLGLRLRPAEMEFLYGEEYERAPDAYEPLLLDCLLGDPTLFARADWVELAWELLEPVLRFWESPAAGPVELYPAGSWGPKSAERLIRREGRRWRVR